MHLRIAVDYSAQFSLIEACRRLQSEPNIERLRFIERLAEVDHSDPPAPEVDFLIRTGGEKRLSDFLLWESAYAELHFSDRLWPDFNEQAFSKRFQEYSRRDRRFGRIVAPDTARMAMDSRRQLLRRRLNRAGRHGRCAGARRRVPWPTRTTPFRTTDQPFYPKDPRAKLRQTRAHPTLALTSIAGATPLHWEVRYWDENLCKAHTCDPLPHAVGITVHLTFARPRRMSWRLGPRAGLARHPGRLAGGSRPNSELPMQRRRTGNAGQGQRGGEHVFAVAGARILRVKRVDQ